MRIVLDTNVLVSGLLSVAGPPGAIVGMLLDGRLVAVYCETILEEYREVLSRPKFGLTPREVDSLLDEITASGLVVASSPWSETMPDPEDGYFLSAAASAFCPLITGNLKHYPIEARKTVKVMTPRQLLDASDW